MFDVVLSGDLKRKPLFNKLLNLYRSYKSIDNVFLMFERNPAVAFNKGARLSKHDKIFFTCDCYVSEELMCRMTKVCKNRVVYVQLSKERVGCYFSGIRAFTSGAFAVERQTILDNPIPESPDFCEEIMWIKFSQLDFIPFFVSKHHFVHLDKHTFRHELVFGNRTTQCRANLKKRGLIRYFYFYLVLFQAVHTWIKQRGKLNPLIELTQIERELQNA